MRVWFNHWFSTAYHLINLIKTGDPGKFVFVGSSTNREAIYKCVCDEWFYEADGLTAEEYVDFCVSFCVEHKIDVFVPRRFLVAIVKNADRFRAVGVNLFADTCSDIIEMLDDKIRTYDYFRMLDSEYVPEVRIARSFEEFTAAYEELRGKVARVCYKLVVDEGARSFRVIDDRIERTSALLEKPGAKITWEAAQKVLGQYDFSIPLLLMPYLSGVEISADCLATPSGNLIIPRYKTNKRYSEVIFNADVMAECSRMMEKLGLKMPLNIQFKKDADRLFLLEINPRMSGGLQLSCKATGLNVPSIAINQLLGVERSWDYPDITAQKVAHIETPICLY
ncbi:MAG: carboxylate--amine ligase [Clostridia bacterium]|nr:carboxylate--amine ligase [Clostridia bacterium]